MISKKIKAKLEKQLTDWIRAKQEMIEPVEPTQGIFNYKCFYNAVQYAYNNDSVNVVEVMIIDGGHPILHYINERNGKYLETTLGFKSQNMEYYKLRRIPPSDWNRLDSEFDRAVEVWTKQFTKPWHRWIGIDRLV